MNMEELQGKIIEELRKKHPERMVVAHTYQKTNAVVVHGISMQGEEDICIEPIISAEALAGFMEAGESVEKLADRAYLELEKAVPDWDIRDLRDKLQDFGWACRHLGVKLINRSKNLHILAESPYVPLLDLALIPIVYFERGGEIFDIRVTYELAKFWREYIKADEELIKLAFDSMLESNAAVLSTMNNYLTHRYAGKECVNLLETGDVVGQQDMLILTNQKAHFGAVGICSQTILDKMYHALGEKTYYILPSSVDEVIIVAGEKDVQMIEDFLGMVADVNSNRQCVPETQVLSNSVYFFNGKGLEMF